MKMYRRLVSAAVLGAMLAGSASVCNLNAALLAPGGLIPAVGETDPVGGLTLANLTAPFSSSLLAGTLTSTVISGDASNPFANGLTFTYQFNVSPLVADSASQISIASFLGFQTDMSYQNQLPGIPPYLFSRSVLGDVVRFNFLATPVLPGESSALLVVQTDARLYTPTTAAIIDGQSINVASFAPLAVPEPGTGALVLAGFGMLLLAMRHRR